MERGEHTLRGMHYQAAPNGEVKIVCTAGAIYDVAVDLRVGSRPGSNGPRSS